LVVCYEKSSIWLNSLLTYTNNTVYVMNILIIIRFIDIALLQFSGPATTKPLHQPDAEAVKPPTQTATPLARSAWGSGQVPNTILANSSSLQQNSGNSDNWPSLGNPLMSKGQPQDTTPSVQENSTPPPPTGDQCEDMAQDENTTPNENYPDHNAADHSTVVPTPDSTEPEEIPVSRFGRRQAENDGENVGTTEHSTSRTQFTSSLQVMVPSMK
jgi:hypothetical protein